MGGLKGPPRGRGRLFTHGPGRGLSHGPDFRRGLRLAVLFGHFNLGRFGKESFVFLRSRLRGELRRNIGSGFEVTLYRRIVLRHSSSFHRGIGVIGWAGSWTRSATASTTSAAGATSTGSGGGRF